MNRRGYIRDIAVGVLGVGFAVAALLIWIPLDIDTGVIDVWRRTVRIGDAMLPVFSAGGILVAAAVIGLRTLLRGSEEVVGLIDLRFVVLSAVILGAGIGAMLITGPLLLWIWTAGETPYRLMLDTAPWKYVGFVTGGWILSFGFMALAGHRFSGRLALIAFVATVLIALLYDLPFDSLLLPPNGDL